MEEIRVPSLILPVDFVSSVGVTIISSGPVSAAGSGDTDSDSELHK